MTGQCIKCNYNDFIGTIFTNVVAATVNDNTLLKWLGVSKLWVHKKIYTSPDHHQCVELTLL